MTNTNLSNAKKAKNDEFYTQWGDIEKEMNVYLEFNPDVFRDKTILLPCDDPEWSNFTKYFAHNFNNFGLKKLISTSYAHASEQIETKTKIKGKVFTLEAKDINKRSEIDIDDLEFEYLSDDGDFRSEEVKKLRDEADIIITNPPFSLFREFLAWIMESDKEFCIIGNMNAVTYKDVFPLIARNQMWLGVTRTGSGSMWFRVDGNFPVKTGQKWEEGKRYQTIGNSAWFTNIDHGRRHQPLNLMTRKDNLKFNNHKGKVTYPEYDNYDAIEVPYVDAIPSDYDGVMGVPIGFLGKYNPDQFEIVSFRKGKDGKDLVYSLSRVQPSRVQPYLRILIKHSDTGTH
ncbi:DNA methyltransferase [Weissella coleopterorum]|uniref:DNA methyltransferase n=1 Tax=Weissella coleopterorum TaxID=2714949 RepID=A0A6G8AYF1_9LACO|nr:adenine-specific methyltransferase EcoRI family protein [Weissella coleopterorum]QIL50084.1 DNA methyltransferase [Weissella coleopterorum]